MNIKSVIGLSLAINGGLIALINTSIYHVNVAGLLVGGAILLGGVYMVVREEFS